MGRLQALALLTTVFSCSTPDGGPRSTPKLAEPGLDFSGAQGCGDLTAYAKNDAFTEILVVEADRKLLGLTTVEQTFSLAHPPAGLTVHFEQAAPEVPEERRFRICDDIVYPDAPLPVRWNAVDG